MEALEAGLGGAEGGFFLSLTLGVGQARAVLSLKLCIQVGAEPSAAVLLFIGNQRVAVLGYQWPEKPNEWRMKDSHLFVQAHPWQPHRDTQSHAPPSL